MNAKRMTAALLLTLLALAATAGPAAASHVHVRLLGNGECVVLAAEGGERFVELPHADAFDADRRHPLHVNVHLGQPGARGDGDVVWVQGSPGDLASCEGYVND